MSRADPRHARSCIQSNSCYEERAYGSEFGVARQRRLVKGANMFFRGFGLMSAVLLLFANAAFAQSIQVLRFLDNAEGAIVQTADGETKTIKAGDRIGKSEFGVISSEFGVKDKKDKQAQSAGLMVTEISEGRIVFEERTRKGLETVIIRVENGKQKIERISKVPEGGPIIYGRGVK